MRQSSSGKEHNLSLRLVLFFPFPLLFSWLSAYLFIDREIQETIPLQFPGCFSVFLREILFEKTFSCWMSAKLSQSESAASCKRLYIRPEFWRECYTPLWLVIGRIIFLTPEETSFAPPIGQNSFAYEKSLVSFSQYVYNKVIKPSLRAVICMFCFPIQTTWCFLVNLLYVFS